MWFFLLLLHLNIKPFKHTAAFGAASATPAAPPAPRAGDDAEASGSDPVIGGTGATHVVVLGWGNASRGDDGLGPLLLARVEALGLSHVTAIEDFQLQLEHALDLKGADLALSIGVFYCGRLDAPTLAVVMRDGVVFAKFWLAISPEEQLRRFKERQTHPLKQWKLSPVCST